MIMTPDDYQAIKYAQGIVTDACDRAGSGHPGAALSIMPIIHYLYQYELNYSPLNPDWIGRDRLIFSSGHACLALYIQNYLSGFKLVIDDLKQYRRKGSKTPGHPELDLHLGVELSTGVLGIGLATSVGIAYGTKYYSKILTEDDNKFENLFKSRVFVIASDGDMQEGISHEAGVFAGSHALSNLIVIYDSNDVTIDGPINLSGLENVKKRFDSYGWDVSIVNKTKDGRLNLDLFIKTINQFNISNKPKLIIVKSSIAEVSPNYKGNWESHGKPLGSIESELIKNLLSIESKQFYVSKKVLKHTRERLRKGRNQYTKWSKSFENWKKEYPEKNEQFNKLKSEITFEDSFIENLSTKFKNSSIREINGIILEYLVSRNAGIIGGSADLTDSNGFTLVKNSVVQSKNSGQYIHYGVRELSMAAISNGISKTMSTTVFCGTYLIFSDFQRPAIRHASMKQLKTIFIYTHDSIKIGGDGPSHQPIEQLDSLRLIPGLDVARPSSGMELLKVWEKILARNKPIALVLTRDPSDEFFEDHISKLDLSMVNKGAYYLKFNPLKGCIKIIATGSEVKLALLVHEKLINESIESSVISMPCINWSEEQDEDYQKYIFSDYDEIRLFIEASTGSYLQKFKSKNSLFVNIRDFGASGDGQEIYEEYGFSVDKIIKKLKAII